MPPRQLRSARAGAIRWTAFLIVAGLWATAATAQSRSTPGAALPAEASAVLDRFAGTWDVTLTVRRPKQAVVTYVQTSAWVLNHRYLRGESSVRPDGSQDLSIFTYDPQARTYPLWIFYSSGFVAYLQHGEWNESSRTMAWKSAAADPIQFTSRCTFENATTLRCATQVKDGKGGVAVDQESVAVRRAP
jgi:hypothetical protein